LPTSALAPGPVGAERFAPSAVTLNVRLPIFPTAPITLAVTVVVPIAKTEPEAGVVMVSSPFNIM